MNTMIRTVTESTFWPDCAVAVPVPDMSVESEGFLIKDGKKAGPIKSFTVAGNFFELLKSIDSLGNEVKWGIPGGFTVFGSPDVLVKDMSVAGK